MPVEIWDCSNADYHAETDHESSTTLKLLHEDPLTYYRARIAKTIPMPRPSPGATNLGAAFEIMLFEPKKFDGLVKVTSDGYKSKGFEKFAATLTKDQIAITADDREKIPEMLKAVHDEPKCAALLTAPGVCQLSVRGTFGKCTAVKLKARFDKLLDDGRPVQLKTTRSIWPGEFSKQSGDLNYHLAEALYRLARDTIREAKALKIGDAEEMEMIVVSNEEPFQAFNYYIGEKSMRLGRTMLQQLVNDLHNYRKLPAGQPWRPAFHGERTEIDIPHWMFPRVEQ